MKKKRMIQGIALCMLMCCAVSCGRDRRNGDSVTAESLLDGETLGGTLAKIAYFETDGYALVQGVKRHYYLYNTEILLDGDDSSLLKYIFEWIERRGGVIDYDNIRRSAPNTGLSESVKALMSSRDADVSVTIYRKGRETVLVVNKADDDYYETTIYPVVGFRWK